jgi:hypothetical protein
MLTVKLYEMFGTETLRHRDTARKIVQNLPATEAVIIDFANISFASQSFLHELLHDLGNRKAIFENRSDEVKQMMEIAEKRVVIC